MMNSTVDFLSEIPLLIAEIQELYCTYNIPWVIGVSWGKDSTCILQLIWRAIAELPLEKRTQQVFICTSDTGVENPQLHFYVRDRIAELNQAAKKEKMPFSATLVKPEVKDSFWVGLIGKGYSYPTTSFRWCTERLKIKPNTKFIKQVVSRYGECILALGTRINESINRRRSMEKHAQNQVRDRLSPSTTLINSLTYSPIAHWTTEQVWLYLMQTGCPWATHGNQKLFQLYNDATDANECAFTIDNKTQTCSKTSRFGCYICTLVNKDSSMTNLIENQEAEYGWMQPLLDLRNEIKIKNNHYQRDFRRMHGQVSLYERQKADNPGETEIVPIPGPYLRQWREHWLRRLLQVQKEIWQTAPLKYRELELISSAELSEIRRIWVEDKHEFDDSLPQIYRDIIGTEFTDLSIRGYQQGNLGIEDWEILEELSADPLELELLTSLLGVEQQYKLKTNRKGIYQDLTKCFNKSSQPKEARLAVAKTQYQLKLKINSEARKVRPAPKKNDSSLSSWGQQKFKSSKMNNE